jgi:hypothetical protein
MVGGQYAPVTQASGRAEPQPAFMPVTRCFDSRSPKMIRKRLIAKSVCGTKGCDSVETVRLSKQSLDDVQADRAIYRCVLHRS